MTRFGNRDRGSFAPRVAPFLVALGCVLSWSGAARAQLHWDVGAEAGVMRRVLTQRPSSASPDAGFGPVVELHGHIAVLPLLRAGVYVTHDIAPVSGIAARQITSGGIHLRLSSPWPRDKWRGWLFAGFGYAGVYGPSYHTTLLLPGGGTTPTSSDVAVDGAGGSYFEIPLGVGVAYKLRRPWELTMELGTRLGFGFSGTLYNLSEGRGGHGTSGGLPVLVDNSGYDSFAVFLSLGVSLEL